MKHLGLTVFTLSLLTAATALADPIPYPHSGTIPTETTIVATSTTVTGYFYSQSAADNDEVRLVDLNALSANGGVYNSSDSSIWVLPNHGSGMTEGMSTTFPTLSIAVGDQLLFQVLNSTTGLMFGTSAAYSSDGVNHGYVTDFTTDGIDPSGMYIGFEDLPVPGSDLDYNDETIVVTGAGTGVAPEPSSLALLGTSIFGLAAGLRRKLIAR
jgi:hypothetical protein